MKQIVLLMLAAIALSMGHAAFAQNSAIPSEQYVGRCLADPDCTTQERLQIMADMSDRMRESVKRINQTCMDMKFKGCISRQHDEIENWHKMNDQMGDMMLAIEVAPSKMSRQKAEEMEKTEPAAGKPDPYLNPDQEKIDRQKNQWWPEWLPPQEENPYHKW